MIGQTVSHYRIVEKLGEGGMGEVYLAEDTTLDRKVALKFLPPHFTKDPEFKARFEHEAKAAAALNHPNIVTVYELSEHEGRLFIAMEHVEGESLEALIRQGVALDQALEITKQTCDGLGDAHAAGIVHRDIKPSNILIDKKGRARILDFGLAKSHKATTETKVGTTLGTLQYESPEQSVGKPVDARSDLFSLGSVLYEMITGRPPFTGEAEEAIRYSILNEQPEPLARFKSGVSQDLQRIVSKLLEKDTKLRYQTAGDLAADLQRLKDRPATSGGSRLPWLMAAAAALVIVAGGYWLTRNRPAADDTEIRLAVLPFENLGDPDKEYFTDGMTEAIISRLSSVSGLSVISRQSAYSFKGTDTPLREIARKLGVAYVLDGTLRWDEEDSTNRILITPQLVDVAKDASVWSNRYERQVTDVFSTQADIAAQVVEALNAALGTEWDSPTRDPGTANPAAYDQYLRGRQYRRALEFENAERCLEQAIQLDTTLVPAYALLSEVYTERSRTEPAFARRARELAETAVRLDPDGGEGHSALGRYHYVVQTDYDSAGIEFAKALVSLPEDSELLYQLGLTRRRRGSWEEARHYLSRAVYYDPLNIAAVSNYTGTCSWMRRFGEALEVIDTLIARSPQQANLYVEKCLLVHSLEGITERVRQLAEAALERVDTASPKLADVGTLLDLAYFEIHILADFESARVHLELARRAFVSGRYGKAASELYHSFLAEAARLSGDTALSRICYDSARILNEQFLAENPVAQSDIYIKLSLTAAYSGLGMKMQALELVDSLLTYARRTRNVFFETQVEWAAVFAALRVHEHDMALDYLERLADKPSPVQTADLRDSPEWAPIRDHRRFRALLARGDKVF